MKKFGILIALLAAVALGGITVPAPPASAESGELTYRSGETTAELDLIGLTATNGPRNVVVTVKVSDLTDQGTFHIGWERRPFVFKVFYLSVRQRDGELKVHYTQLNDGIRRHPRCDEGVVRWQEDRDQIKVRVPQSCWIGRIPRRSAFSASSEGPDGSGDNTRKYLILERG